MARTRTQIKAAVGYNTGRGTQKATLIETLCDEALKVAVTEHAFRDALSYPSDITITEDATSVDISSISNLVHIVSARIIEASGSRNAPLVMKDRTWWAKNVVNASDNPKGWPVYGLRQGTTVLLDRPASGGLTLRLVVSVEQTFTNDASACPIAILDTFVVQYVTAFVFLSIENDASYWKWRRLAIGPRWDEGIVGGSLIHAIQADKFDISEEFRAERYGEGQLRMGGLAIENLDTGHDRYGEIDIWY